MHTHTYIYIDIYIYIYNPYSYISTCNPYRLVLYQREDFDFYKIYAYIALSNLVSSIHEKI